MKKKPASCICIGVILSPSNQVVGYRIKNVNNNKVGSYKSSMVRCAIEQGKIKVSNLKVGDKGSLEVTSYVQKVPLRTEYKSIEADPTIDDTPFLFET